MSRQNDSSFIIEQISYINRHIRLPDELVARLDWIAVKNRVTLSNLIVQCCNYALAHLQENTNSDL